MKAPSPATAPNVIPQPRVRQPGRRSRTNVELPQPPEPDQLLTLCTLDYSGTGFSKLGKLSSQTPGSCLRPNRTRDSRTDDVTYAGFAGNDSPSFVFPTAIATKAGAGSTGGSGSGRPAVANKPSFLTGGAGPSGHMSSKRGTEDLDYFIGDEAVVASGGPGYGLHYPIRHGQIENWVGELPTG